MPQKTIKKIYATVSALLFILGSISMSNSANAFEVQILKSPSGIEFWLVESDTLPLVTMDFSFKNGSVRDKAGKEGTAYFLSGLLDEGAGDLDSEAFQNRLEETQIRLSFDANLDSFSGRLKTLSSNLDDAQSLTTLALNSPRFDEEPLDRVREQILSSIRARQFDPDAIASRTWFEMAYPDHPYGRSVRGTETTVKDITKDDLVSLHKEIFSKEELSIAIVGDISVERAGQLVDTVFGELPESSTEFVLPNIDPAVQNNIRHVDLDVPQTSIRFGRPGLDRHDPDFFAGFVMNHILGGGSFTSWLYEEVREKRGLSYSVYSFLYPLEASSIIFGGAATEQDRAQTSIDVIIEQITRMAKEGPTEEKLQEAKTFLKGSYPLRFDTSSKIASQLSALQSQGFTPSYITDRSSLIDAVTLEDIKRVAKRVLGDSSLSIVTVGRS